MQPAAGFSHFTSKYEKEVLRRYLSVARVPIDLPTLSQLQPTQQKREDVVRLVKEMAVRTSRSYQAFHDPIIEKTMRRPHSERLHWVKGYVLREFNYCVALHSSVEKITPSVSAIGASTDVEIERGDHLSWASSIRALRNTDDKSFIYCDSGVGNTSAEPQSLAASCSVGATSFPGLLNADKLNAEMSREEVATALTQWEDGKSTIPFPVALRLLRPQQSLLDVMVNEAAIRSEKLNGWFLRFCCCRVAWRVLHEHLLYLICPSTTAQVISSDTDIVSVLREAGDAVADIFSNLVENGTVHALTIELEEDATIFQTLPSGTLISSSTCRAACHVTSAEAIQPVSSSRVYSVEAHLTYIFREVLKNACAATLKITPEIHVIVKYAINDEWVVVDFTDYAEGIDARYFKDIWKFGWTTSTHYESHLGGFGVGLPTSKVYMDMWGGSIDIYSAVGRGTTVRVRFPKAPTEICVPDAMLPPLL